MTELEELRAENERLRHGEDFVRKLAVEMYADCIKGLVDAVIIKQQRYDLRHVASAVRQLSETAEGWRKGYDQLKVLVNELTDLKDKAELRAGMIVEDGQDVPEEHRAKSAGYADAYSYCILQLKRVLEAYDGQCNKSSRTSS